MGHGWLWLILGAVYLLVVLFFIGLGRSAKIADRRNAEAAARYAAEMRRREEKEEA